MTTVMKMLSTGECLVAPQGDIDLATAPDLVAEFEYAMEHLSPHVLVDLSEVSFIDSSGLAALVRARLNAEGGGGSFALTGADDAINALLKLTKLDQFFEIRALHPRTPAAAPASEEDHSLDG